ncbi:MAG: hypothetical protein M3Y86_05075, partial [Verrucomicrobiota bacterium]|nr:hypothetical protein [Verrucomicrobiota bacterium]
GWAPLPPEARFEKSKGIKHWADSYYDIGADEYVFIPNEEIGAENVERYALPAERNASIVTQTTNVTNLTYNNTTIVDEGPNYEQLRGHSRQAVPRLKIQRENEVRDAQGPQSRINGDVISMVTPRFTHRGTEKPQTEGAPIRQATVERNWASGGNPAEAERARAKMHAEATAPPDAPTKRFHEPPMMRPTASPITRATAAATATPTATPLSTPTATPSATMSATATAAPASTPVVTATPVLEPAASAAPARPPLSAPKRVPPAPPIRATPAATTSPEAVTEPTEVRTKQQMQRDERVRQMAEKMQPRARPTPSAIVPPPAVTPPPAATPQASATPQTSATADAGAAEVATPALKPEANRPGQRRGRRNFPPGAVTPTPSGTPEGANQP